VCPHAGAARAFGAAKRGEVFFFARNDDPGDSEFTGPTFSQDKKILFANIQSPGYVSFTKQR
jgi:secreted PhoX family phosphatase